MRGIHWSPVDSPHKGPVMRIFDIFFVASMNKQLMYHWSCQSFQRSLLPFDASVRTQIKFTSSIWWICGWWNSYLLPEVTGPIHPSLTWKGATDINTNTICIYFFIILVILFSSMKQWWYLLQQKLTHWGWDKMGAIFQTDILLCIYFQRKCMNFE